MFLRIFSLFFSLSYLSSFETKAADTVEGVSNIEKFGKAKIAILEKIDALIAEKQGEKLELTDFVGNSDINCAVNTLLTVSFEAGEEDITLQIKSLMAKLFDEELIATQNVIDKSGGSAAKTYLEENGGRILRAIKVYDIEGEYPEHLYEFLSRLYSKREIDQKLGAPSEEGEGICIGFSGIEMASFWKMGDAKKFVIVFKGAAGQVVDSIMEKIGVDATLPVASAFALFHEKTKFESHDHEDSDWYALGNIIITCCLNKRCLCEKKAQQIHHLPV